MKGLFPGTFDPPTIGHKEIILRGAACCDELYVGIAENGGKHPSLFTVNERRSMLEKILPKIKVVTFSGLVVDFAKKENFDLLIRGIRNSSDFEYEAQMAFANRKMTGIETLFLLAEGDSSLISSTLIREIGSKGRRLHGFVPEEIEAEVFHKLFS